MTTVQKWIENREKKTMYFSAVKQKTHRSQSKVNQQQERMDKILEIAHMRKTEPNNLIKEMKDEQRQYRNKNYLMKDTKEVKHDSQMI